MSEPLSAEELERVRAGGSTPGLVATIDALTAERDEAKRISSVISQEHFNIGLRLLAAEAQVERLTKVLERCAGQARIGNGHAVPQMVARALASEGSSDE